MNKLINIGYGNLVNVDKVIAIVSAESAPAKRQIIYAKDNHKIIDATQGRKTKSIIYTSDDYIITSSLQTDTLINRFER
ncbi:extracellular matrix/biofilm biosynthesis regulator RemA family protein [Lachnobacterium bovis]|uniref:Regulatory protein n=1 Tax=Lachnobacterium bovis TaxID=140626 RepID=A0A1H9QQX6_9FIRM|nr:extracellular matrix/biofilm biosynthesis regulator RemA family protein [Lachnobacterium bovis]SER62239.1 hypothetical protein SAMN02910429_00632 [Lachnobacterium bovis]